MNQDIEDKLREAGQQQLEELTWNNKTKLMSELKRQDAEIDELLKKLQEMKVTRTSLFARLKYLNMKHATR